MKIHPRFYPVILISAFLVFFLLGLLLGFLPEGGGEGHGRSSLLQTAYLAAGSLP